MALSAGDRLGPYEIIAAIGAGGMGEVYRARDTRLDRTVAVKVLPAHTADRPDVRQRFEREARAVSALNHPHICTLHDVGQQAGTDYLVMEFLEGETLADRLAKGALPMELALRLATQVADALDRAHRTGITHRDLKPGNIMLTKDGAKVLDFGLAKMRERAPGALSSGGTVVETLTSPLTGQGAIIGTLQYMAPEQLEGQEADARSDIFSFGAILYEMVAGRRAFDGKTQATLIAKILEHDPAPVSTVMPAAPPALDQLLRSCLAKDPAERRQTMHDVLLDLRWIAQGSARETLAAPVAAAKKKRPRVWMAATAVLALATVALAVLYELKPRPEAALMRFAIPPPEKTAYGYGLALSPDGKRVVFSGLGVGGVSQLWVRALDSLAAQPVPGTSGATFPFWSPDNRFLGFFADGKLKKADLAGGPVQILADAPDGRGGSWSPEGVILFAPTTNLPLQRISAGGGTPVAVTKIGVGRKEVSHRWPHFLPDGRHFVCFSYCSGPGNAIAAGSLDQPDLTILTLADSAPMYSPPGFLLYVKSNILVAQPFDISHLRLAGDAVPVAQDVAAEGEVGPTAFARFSVSRTGMLAYVTGTGTTGLLTWFDRAGKVLGTVGDSGSYAEQVLSPDQKRLVFDWNDSPAGNNLWVADLTRNVKARFSSGSTFDYTPVWSPDGTRIVFGSRRAGASDLYVKPASGGGTEELLFSSNLNKFPDDWSADGRTVVFEVENQQKRRIELWTLSMADRKASPYIQAEYDTAHAALSPDGHWIAYTSTESGRPEVYVQSFPVPTGGKYLVSAGGGDQPSWRRDGRELFYFTQDQKLMAVPVATGAAFQAQAPNMLFQPRTGSGSFGAFGLNGTRNAYTATADGQRFLVSTATDAVSSSPMIVVLNWNAGMRR